MNSLRFISLLAVHLACGWSGYAAVSNPEQIPQEFIRLWNSHEARGFEEFFTTDAVWVPVAEARDEGREAIVKDLMAAHAGWAKKSKLVLDQSSAVAIRMIKPDVATIFFRMKFLDLQDQPITGLERAMVIVATKSETGWKVEAGQLTKESAMKK